jgi:hypothetical protein
VRQRATTGGIAADEKLPKNSRSEASPIVFNELHHFPVARILISIALRGIVMSASAPLQLKGACPEV